MVHVTHILEALPAAYGLVIIVLALLAFSLVLHGMVFVGAARKKVFTKKFFSEKFPELKPFPVGGYPDTGSGYYSQKLSHEDWLTFNNAQRAHLNFLEMSPALFTFVAFGGLGAPRVTAIAGLITLVGRWLYGIQYAKMGPAARRYGALLSYIGFLTSFGTTIYTGLSLVGGLEGITKIIFA